MGESHAFGQSLCCSRRHFVMAACLGMAILCAVRVIHWTIVFVSSVGLEQRPSCTGDECFEVFSCYGLKDTTAHIMEPLFSLSGLFFFGLGFHGAHHGDDLQMKRFSIYLMFATAIRLGVIIFDVSFLATCKMYDSHVMNFVLTPPLSPIPVGVQEKLLELNSFPKETVDVMASGVHVLAWYLVFNGLWALFFLYVTVEALQLSSLMQYGLLGLGVHFGLDQWDEELNRAAIRRKMQRGLPSQFMDDAYLPLNQGSLVGGLQGYGSYGKEMSMEQGAPIYVAEVEEDEAEVVRQLAERLSSEESPEAILERSFD